MVHPLNSPERNVADITHETQPPDKYNKKTSRVRRFFRWLGTCLSEGAVQFAGGVVVARVLHPVALLKGLKITALVKWILSIIIIGAGIYELPNLLVFSPDPPTQTPSPTATDPPFIMATKTGPSTPVGTSAPSVIQPPFLHEVQPHDSLESLCQAYDCDWTVLAQVNGVAAPDYIIYDKHQILILPQARGIIAKPLQGAPDHLDGNDAEIPFIEALIESGLNSEVHAIQDNDENALDDFYPANIESERWLELAKQAALHPKVGLFGPIYMGATRVPDGIVVVIQDQPQITPNIQKTLTGSVNEIRAYYFGLIGSDLRMLYLFVFKSHQ